MTVENDAAQAGGEGAPTAEAGSQSNDGSADGGQQNASQEGAQAGASEGAEGSQGGEGSQGDGGEEGAQGDGGEQGAAEGSFDWDAIAIGDGENIVDDDGVKHSFKDVRNVMKAIKAGKIDPKTLEGKLDGSAASAEGSSGQAGQQGGQGTGEGEQGSQEQGAGEEDEAQVELANEVLTAKIKEHSGKYPLVEENQVRAVMRQLGKTPKFAMVEPIMKRLQQENAKFIKKHKSTYENLQNPETGDFAIEETGAGGAPPNTQKDEVTVNRDGTINSESLEKVLSKVLNK